jgi:DNA-binding NtrC family response regulator
MSIEIPPLRERKKEDIPLLTEYFQNEFTRARGKIPIEMRPEAMELLLTYDWPGNLRELRNVLERAVILARGAPIGPQHLPQDLAQRTATPSSSSEERDLRSLEEVEIAHIRQVLKATGHNHSRSARVLGLHRTTLLDKIKKHGLESGLSMRRGE